MNTYIKTIILWTINSFDRRIWSRKLLPARIGNWNLQSLQFSIKLTLKKHKQFSVVYFEINQTTIFIQSFFWKKRKSLKDILSIKKEQLFANVLQNMCSLKFCSIHRKTPVLESLFNKVASFQEEGKKRLNADVFLCCKIFYDTFFTEHLRWLLHIKNREQTWMSIHCCLTISSFKIEDRNSLIWTTNSCIHTCII